MKVKYVGFGGYMEVPCYEDENGKLYFDENDGGRFGNGLNLFTGAYRDDCGEICGEPNIRVTEQIECNETFVRNSREFDYRMLSRLQSDCEYFLGNGNGYEGHLPSKDVNKHCDEMEKIWNSFSDDKKPEWLKMEQIKEYREKMLKMRRK